MSSRKKIPQDVETDVLIKSKRRCCLCFGIQNDLDEKNGQIAHIDKNRDNNNFDNLAFLCFNHHDKYDAVTSQSKNYTKNEVKRYRDDLYGYYEKLYDNDISNNDFLDYLNKTIRITSERHEVKDNKVIVTVDNLELMNSKTIELELWNDGKYELVINKIIMQNKLPFHYSSEHWTPLPFKGSDKDNTFTSIRYINNHFHGFEIESNKYINLYYNFPQLRIGFAKKVYTFQFDFLVDITIPSKSFNYKITDVSREVMKTIYFDFVLNDD
ncbi:hypothetical protein [Paenibacillus turpanensis]|uniref:hypothetical protein n=1 Tax=Paenibacillus turpanensis TaxID=2689078 RepID=UPI00140DC53E|nr:hypothetical protein [Paenibacillus turpanensis]